MTESLAANSPFVSRLPRKFPTFHTRLWTACVLAPLPEAAHAAHQLPYDVSGEKWTEPVPPMPHRFTADGNTLLPEQPVLDVPQAQREEHIHYQYRAGHLGRELTYLEGCKACASWASNRPDRSLLTRRWICSGKGL